MTAPMHVIVVSLVALAPDLVDFARAERIFVREPIGVVHVDPPATVTVFHEGTKIQEGLSDWTVEDTFTHKEVALTIHEGNASWDIPQYFGSTPMCGVGLFTKKRLTCTTMVADDALRDQVLPSDRGYGIELEMVARDFEFFFDANESVRLPHIEHEVVLGEASELYPLVFGVCAKQVKEQLAWNKKMLSDVDLESCVKSAASGTAWRMAIEKFERGELETAFARAISDAFKIPRVAECFKQAGSQVLGSFPEWEWVSDVSVHPLSESEAKFFSDKGFGFDETQGVPFEIVSPVLSGANGIRSATVTLALLRHMGVQAGPSQGFHVHVNVIGDAPGKKLTYRQIAKVWAAWAKYQLAIDEMMSPSRPDNEWSRRLWLGKCVPNDGGCSEDNLCPCAHAIFEQLHAVSDNETWQTLDKLDFCNKALAWPELEQPCNNKYPEQRNYQLNLHPIQKYGTIEFRVHSGTYSGDRVRHWIKFLIAFVEHFGLTDSMDEFFDGGHMEDLNELAEAQRLASMGELFDELKLTKEERRFYMKREWEEDPVSQFACAPQRGVGRNVGEPLPISKPVEKFIKQQAEVKMVFAKM